MAFTTPPTAGQRFRGRVLADLFGELYVSTGIKTIDQNVGPSNTTMQEVDEVLVFVEAEKTYEFDLVYQHSTGTTPDSKFGFSYPTGLTMDYAAFVYGSTGTWIATRNTQTAVFSPNGGSLNSSAWLHGTIQVGAESGVLQLMAAQNVSDASTTNIEAGTMIRVVRIDP